MKTFTCNICGQEVSKRQSQAFNDGRCCRHHQELQDMKDAEIAKKEEQATFQKVNDMMNKMALVSLFRVHGIPMAFGHIERRLKKQYGEVIYKEAMAEALDSGPLSNEEIVGALMMHRQLNNKDELQMDFE